MPSKQISRLTVYTTGEVIDANEHNAEHQQYVDNFNELFQSFDYDGTFHRLWADKVKFNFSALDLETLASVSLNPDGTVRADKVVSPNWTVGDLESLIAVAHNPDGTIKSNGIDDALIYAHNNDTTAHQDIRDILNTHTHKWEDISNPPDFTVVKLDSADDSPGYLSDKIDNNTLEIDDVLRVIKVKDGIFANASLSNVADADFLAKMLANDGIDSGLDADLVRGLPADFSSVLSGAGYQKLPSGLILQWGQSSSSSSQTTVVFPIAFPNNVLALVACFGVYSSSTINSLVVNDITTTNATITNSGIPFFWFAIGY